MKTSKFKPNKVLTDAELEQKIMSKYTKDNPEPKTLQERVKVELNKLNK